MSEHRPGEGGSANTPPFPRLVQDDAGERKADPPVTSASPSSERIHIVAEAVARPEIREMPVVEGAGESTPALKALGRDEAEEKGESQTDDLSDLMSDAADHVRRAGRKVNRGFENVAAQLEDLADRLDSVAGLGEARGAAQLAGAARKTSEILGDSARYLREKDVKEMRGDLEGQVRAEPLRTLALAMAAGWLVGKIVR